MDSSPHRNVYLSKKDIKGESRLAITTHGEGEVGVCLRNYIIGSAYWFGALFFLLKTEKVCRINKHPNWRV